MELSPKPEKYIDILGPNDDPKKYGLITKLGMGKYGVTYKARNMNRQKDEDEFYAVKILIPPVNLTEETQKELEDDWLKETKCLKDVMTICSQVGILCFKDSFIMNNDKKMNYVIVTPFLDGYINLYDYLFGKDSKSISEKEARRIYKKVVDVKNALTDLCLTHSDLHTNNIMINPKTNDIKIIDLGRCQTPQEEIQEWNPPSKKWDKYSDEARLRELREQLYQNIYDEKPEDSDEFNDFEDKLMKYAPIKKHIPGCKRGGTKGVPTKKEFVADIKYLINLMSLSRSALQQKPVFETILTFSLENKEILDIIPGMKKALLEKIKEFTKNEIFKDLYRYYELLE